jgi:hypothetical protein
VLNVLLASSAAALFGEEFCDRVAAAIPSAPGASLGSTPSVFGRRFAAFDRCAALRVCSARRC